MQSEGVKQQLNNITDSINQAALNEEIDVSVNSFTNLVGAIAESFLRILIDHKIQKVQNQTLFTAKNVNLKN